VYLFRLAAFLTTNLPRHPDYGRGGEELMWTRDAAADAIHRLEELRPRLLDRGGAAPAAAAVSSLEPAPSDVAAVSYSDHQLPAGLSTGSWWSL
jgi:hypothetical protein